MHSSMYISAALYRFSCRRNQSYRYIVCMLFKFVRNQVESGRCRPFPLPFGCLSTATRRRSTQCPWIAKPVPFGANVFVHLDSLVDRLSFARTSVCPECYEWDLALDCVPENSSYRTKCNKTATAMPSLAVFESCIFFHKRPIKKERFIPSPAYPSAAIPQP